MLNADSVYRRGPFTGYDNYPVVGPVDPALLAPVQDPQQLFPPRFGYPQAEPTVMDVLRTNRIYPDSRSQTSGYSGPGYSGTARPANSWW